MAKSTITNIDNGNGTLVIYNEDGTLERSLTFKDGEIVKD